MTTTSNAISQIAPPVKQNNLYCWPKEEALKIIANELALDGCDSLLAQKTMESEFYRSLADNCDSMYANIKSENFLLVDRSNAQNIVIQEKDRQLNSFETELKLVKRENTTLKKQKWWIVGIGGTLFAILTGTTIYLAK